MAEISNKTGQTALKFVSENVAQNGKLGNISVSENVHKNGEFVNISAADLPRNEGKDQADNVSLKHGNQASYLASRIKRDHPEIAKRVEAGEFPSLRKAAIEVFANHYLKLILVFMNKATLKKAGFLKFLEKAHILLGK